MSSYVNLLNPGGFLESCQSNSYTFIDTHVNDILLSTDNPEQNIFFGTQHDIMSSMKITSNIVHFNQNIYTSNAFGLGTSNFLHYNTFHKFTMVAPSNNIYGPHIGVYTDDDTSNPLLQMRNWAHNDITQSYDSYWNGSNWISSDSNANFRIMKKDGKFLFTSACNRMPGQIIDSNWRTSLSINSNSFIGIGNSNPSNRLTVRAEDSSVLGPHIDIYTDLDTLNPLYQMRNWTHNDITQSYDSYWNGSNWISSDSNANFRMMKKDGKFLFTSACNQLPGSIIDSNLRTALSINSNSFIGIGTSNPTNKLTIRSLDSSIYGPHIDIFTTADRSNPLLQMRNWSHNDITQSYDSYWNGSNWISSDSNANFRVMKKDGKFLFTSACNQLPGSIVDSNWRTALSINSNSFIGIGTSNPSNRITVRAEDSSILGPHLDIYTNIDTSNPLYQMRNWSHNDITQSYDSYWNGSNWISSDSNANFRVMKKDGKFLFTSACNQLPGSIVDSNWSTSLSINSNSFIGIGTSNPTNKLTIRSLDSSIYGPHVDIYTDIDTSNPLLQMRNWTHNDITHSYDSYWNGNNWISSDSNANFRMMKKDGKFLFTSACNKKPGSAIDNSWRTALSINSNSFIGIGNSNPSNRVTVRAEDSSILGPHVDIYTDIDTSNPLYQMRNWSHNDITQSYDSYWNGSNWISSDSNANFRVMKKDGKFLFTSACNQLPGSIVDSNWSTSLSINSNSFIGIGTSNPTNKLTIRSLDSSLYGPHIDIYTDLDSSNPLYQMKNWTHNDITQSYDSYWNGSNWISSDSNANFRVMKKDGKFLFTSACNQLPGSIIDSNWRTALSINSNSFIGIGTSNPSNRVTVRAEDSSILGPHLDIYTTIDSSNPLYQMRNWSHNDITQSYDSYWNGNNWISSDSNANFRMMKKDGKFLFTSACNQQPGSIVDSNWRTSLSINSNSFIGIGTSNLSNRVTVRAEDSSILGPHIDIYTDLDNSNPLYQMRNWAHNDITQSYDSYWNGSNWISSDSNANFRMMKKDGKFLFTSACNQLPGSIIDSNWRTSLSINSNSFIGIGTSNPTNKLTIRSLDSSLYGPHIDIYTDLDSSNPLYQMKNWTHNDITQSYDSYWNGSNWISSDSNANFRIMKKDGKFLFTSACNQLPGQIIDSNWRTSLSINSNSFIGIGTSNPSNRITVRAEDSSILGPHIDIYTDLDTSNPLYQMRNWSHNDITQSYDSYWNGSNWISSDSNANFRVMKKDGKFLFTSACNQLQGSIMDSNWKTALSINSNSFIGIGTSNPTNKLTIRSLDSSIYGPHIDIFTTADRSNPLLQMRNWSHNDITQSYDSYWNGSNWISSDSNANFRVMKKDGKFLFTSACNQLPGSIVDSNWRTALSINSNSFIGIGNSNPTNRITVRAEDSSILGPHLDIYTNIDTSNPLYQMRNWAHNDITQSYDSYWNGSNWISSDSNANFRMMKKDGKFLFTSACNQLPGSIVDSNWSTSLSINSNSFIGIGTSNPTNKLTIRSLDSSIYGPHVDIFTDLDTSNPLYQMRNWSHNDISQSYDCYHNGSNWISSDSNANFRMMKKDGKFLFTSACNQLPGSIVDSNWSTSLSINSNSFIGIGTSNPTNKLTIRSLDSSIYGPHVDIFTDLDTINPLYQMRNWAHDDIAISFDSYWNSSNWVSSSSNGNFQIYKQNGRLIFYSACNINASSNLSSNLFPAFTINSNSFIGIGLSNPTHRLTITGPSNDISGPHIGYYLSSDSNYPVFQQYNFNHDKIALSFDSFWNGSNWISSSSNGNFQIIKENGTLLFQNAVQNIGSVLDNSWFSALSITSNSYIGIGTSNPSALLDINGTVIFRCNVAFTGDIIPNSNNIFNLGSSNLRWRDLYLSGNSIDMDGLNLKKDYTSGGLIVYDKNIGSVSRICVKELLIGDPTNLLNSNVFLMRASSNGLHFDNVTSNVPVQTYSQLNNMFVTTTNVGIGNSNPEKSLNIYGDFEINPNIIRQIDWTLNILRVDISEFQGESTGKKIANWNNMSVIGNPIYNKTGGFYDGPYIQCSYGSNYLTLSNSTFNTITNDGFTAVAFIRFTRDARSNETIFEFNNNNNYLGLTRNLTSSQLRFATDEISSTPIFSPSNIISQNEWCLYSVRYDGTTNLLELYKNIDISYNSSNELIFNPISSTILPIFGNKIFNSSNVSIGNANIDISHLYFFDRYIYNNELLDLSRSILYNANASIKIRTDIQPYPTSEFYSDSNGWVSSGIKNGGQVYKKSYTQMMYGNGTYKVWANSENSNTKIYNAFNTDITNNWSTLSNIYNILNDSIPPVIIYIELPNLIAIQAYTITSSYTTPIQTPSKWRLKGSIDNNTYFIIHTVNNEISWGLGENRIYYVNSISPAKFFKFEIFKNGSASSDYITIETFQLYGSENNFQIDGTGVGIGTSLLKEKLTVEGNVSISQCNIVGKIINDVKNNILSFPPNYISTSNVTLINQLYGNGNYIISQSTSNTSNDGFYAFDNLLSTYWASASNNYNTSGTYTGTQSTIMNGVSYKGEWLQIQLPQSTRLNSYRITPNSYNSAVTSPASFYICGSVDGNIWTQIDYQSKIWGLNASASNFNVSSFSNTLFYNYYRIVNNKIGNGSTSITSPTIVDFKLYGEIYTNPTANVGKIINYGDTYISDHLDIGTKSLYDDSKKISINAIDIQQTIISGGNVNIWGVYGQNNTSYQPLYYNTGGYMNLPYVRFVSSNISIFTSNNITSSNITNGTFLSAGSDSLQINTNDGMTIVSLMRFTGSANLNDNIITFRSNNNTLGNTINFSRSALTQQLSFTIYNNNATASNSLQTGINTFAQYEWAIFAARYTNSLKKIEIFKNNSRIAWLTTSNILTDNTYNFNTIGGANIDIGALYVWDTAISDYDLTHISDVMMQGYPSLVVDGSTRFIKAIEGSLSVKSANTYTNTLLRYPVIDLISNKYSVLNQIYGNGLYNINVSTYYQNNDTYNGYNALQSSGSGWLGESNAYDLVTGLYIHTFMTVIGILNKVSSFGDWFQIETPDIILSLYYTIYPRSDYANTAPVSWYLLGSTNNIDWNILDTQTNYSFASQTEITFNISSNTIPYKFYRLSIIKINTSTINGNVGFLRFSLYSKSRTTVMCQDDKVIVFDKLAIGLTQPLETLSISGNMSLSNFGKVIISTSNNQLGIFNANPSATLDVNGTFNTTNNATFQSNVIIMGSLTVNNIEYVTSNVTVYESEVINSNLTVLNNIVSDGNLVIYNTSTLCNTVNIYGSLNVFSNALFNSNVNIGSNLYVNGISLFTGISTLSNTTNIYGQLNTFSNAIFNSNVVIGSNLLVQQGASLSNTVNIYGKLNTFSNARFNSNVTVGSNLIVYGVSTLCNITNIYGSLNTYTDSIFNSNVYIGSNLTVYANTTLSNTTIIYGQLNVFSNATFNSNVNIGSNLTVYANTTLSNTTNIYGQLNTFSNATFNSNVNIGSNLLVNGITTLSNTTNIYGQLNVFSNATFNSNVNIGSNLLVNGITTLSNTINIYGQLNTFSNATFNSNVNIGSNLLVNGISTLSNTINIYGQLNTFSNATFNSNVNIGSNLLVNGISTLSNTTIIYGQLNIFNNANFNSNVNIGSNLLVNGISTLSNTTNIYGQLNTFNNVNFNSNVNIGSNLLVNGITTLSNTTNIYGQLNTFSNANFNSNVYVGSNLLVNGTSMFTGIINASNINIYGELTTFSNVLFNSNVNIGSNLYVNGTSVFTGAIYTNDINISGELTTFSNVIFNSNVYIGSNLSVQQGASFSNTINIYGKLNTFSNARFNSNVTVGSNLIVYGVSTLCNITNIYGLLNTYIDSTFNSNVYIGSNLTVYANTTLSNTTNIYGQLNTFSNATFNSNVNIGSNLLVNGITTLSNTTNIYGQLNTFSNATFNSNVYIGSNLLVNGITTLSNVVNIYAPLNTYIDSTFNSNVIIGSNLLLLQGASLSNTINIYGKLNTYSNARFNSNVTVGSNLIVYGVSTLCNITNIYGQLTTFSNALFNSNVNIGSNLYVIGTSIFTGAINTSNINIYGELTTFSNVLFNSNVNIGSNLYVAGISSLSNTNIYGQLNVFSNALFNSNIIVGSNLLVNGISSLSNITNIYGQLNVFSNAIFNSNIIVGSNLLVNGITSLSNITNIYGILNTFNNALFNSNVTVGSNLTVNAITTLNTTNIYGSVGTSLVYPPAAISANSYTMSGKVYGNGSYTISASSTDGDAAYQAFDSNVSTFWGSANTYSGSPGSYTGSVSTSASGSNLLGEWVQLQLPTTILIQNYAITSRSFYTSGRAPYTWYYLGSLDGSTWTILDTQTAISNWVNSGSTQTFTVSTSVSYNYYRLVINKTNSGDNASIGIAELRMTTKALTINALNIIGNVSFSNNTGTIGLTSSNTFLGINNSSPAYLLDVGGTINATSILINGSVLSTSTGGGFTAISPSISYSMCNIGIGTSNPSAKLHLSGTGITQQMIYSATDSITNSKNWAFGPNGLTFYGYIMNDAFGSTQNWVQVLRSTTTITSVCFPSGNIGIGTTTPGYALDVNGTVNATAILINGSPISSSSGGGFNAIASSITYTNCNVGIGTSSPSAKLHLSGTGITQQMIYSATDAATNSKNWAFGPNGSSFYGYILNDLFGSSQNWLQVIRSAGTITSVCFPSGNIGVGTTSPSYTLDIVGNSRIVTASSNTGLFISTNTNAPLQVAQIALGIPSGQATLIQSITQSGGHTDFNFVTTSNNINKNSLYITGSTGNVGIGTSTPAYLLDVTGNARVGSMRIDGATGIDSLNLGGVGIFGIDAPGIGNGRFALLDNGNVGIGTPLPQGKLDVAGQIILNSDSGWSSGGIRFRSTNSNVDGAIVQGGNGIMYFRAPANDGAGGYQFLNGGATVNLFTISNNGNIGINITAPLYNLDVNGNARITGTFIATSNIQIGSSTIGNPATGIYGGAGDRLLLYPGTTSTHPYSLGITGATLWSSVPVSAQHQWYNGGSVSMTLSNSLLGIGTTSPQGKLDVAGQIILNSDSGWSSGGVRFRSTNLSVDAAIVQGGNGILYFRAPANDGAGGFQFYNGGASTALVGILNNGNMGLGTTSPSYTLHVIGSIYASGDITALSDIRYKTNINILINSLNNICSLNGYSYTRTDFEELKEKENTKHIGLLAQEVQKVIPEVISYDKENDKYGIKYGNMIALLVESIKEMRQEYNAKISKLEDKIYQLENK